MGLCGRRGAVVAAALVAFVAGSGAASAASVNVKLPYGIAYDLSPIQIDVSGGQSWHIFDIHKQELAKGALDGATKTVTFTPPRYGWYAVEVGTERPGPSISGAAKFIGVTPKFPNMHTLVQGELHGGWNDEALQAFAGFLCDRTNTHWQGLDGAARVADQARKYGVTLIMQFEGYGQADNLQHVRDAVTKLKDKVKYWEVVNEPNFGGGPDKYFRTIQKVYPLIKSIDPQAVVMGPDTCGINLGWNEGFLKMGGGKYIDALSVHDYEGDDAIDHFHWEYVFGELRKMMNKYGCADKPIWQTERTISAVVAKTFRGGSQAVRTTLQRDILETFGIPGDHNNHYYVQTTGYEAVPSYVFSDSGPHPAALTVRTRAAMTVGRKFVHKLDFGPSGNKIFLGLLYQGADGSTVTLRNYGALDQKMTLDVSGGDAIEVVDTFGNSEKAPVAGGKAAVTVSQWPIYLRLAPGQKVTVPKMDFGRNIARQAKFTWSAASKSDPKLLADGVFQIAHGASPWGSPWAGTYAGKKFNEKTETLEMAFDGPRTVGQMLVFSIPADNPHCALLDYDLQYWNGSAWVTIEEARTPCPPSDPVATHESIASTWYLDNQMFVHQFKPVTTAKLRMLVRRISRGCFIDTITEDTVNWRPATNALELREIEIYEVPGAGGAGPNPAKQAAAAEVEATTGTVVHAFTSGTMVQVFQLAQGILADTWNGKDRGAK